MAKPNYQFQKRQKELEKIKKAEEKLQRKREKQAENVSGSEDQDAVEEE
jgi:hypothetical protein